MSSTFFLSNEHLPPNQGFTHYSDSPSVSLQRCLQTDPEPQTQPPGMTRARTIQLFLPDGNPRGVKIAEFTSRTIQAVLVPRAQLDFACSRDELRNVGVYFLFGNEGNSSLPQVYVGEAEDCATRLKQHHKLKDWWRSPGV